jgi:16S rRNA (uracil1498-N3)-methyltransferase
MTRRYFVSHLPAEGGMISLDEAETHHAINVMRIRVGESVCLFDGVGSEAMATVQAVTRREVFCEAKPSQRLDRENHISLTIGVAMPKGDRSKELIERLTELGVNELVPLHCQRTQWPVTDNAIQKWHRVVIDACKQSGRNQLMKIASPQPACAWFSDASLVSVPRFIAHPTETPFDVEGLNTTKRVVVAIGPEGGFSDEEVQNAQQNRWYLMSLGARIYRIETAALLAAIKLARLYE